MTNSEILKHWTDVESLVSRRIEELRPEVAKSVSSLQSFSLNTFKFNIELLKAVQYTIHLIKTGQA